MWPLWLFFIAVSYCIMKYWELRSLLAWQKYLPAPPSKNILLVTAHPDDEVMFFSPLINSLKYFTTSTVHVLCLSAGHFRDARDPNLGKIRSAELAKAVQELRVDRFEIADRVDGTEEPGWDVKSVGSIIHKYYKEHNIDQVFTFDSNGLISGIINLQEDTSCTKFREQVSCFELRTMSLLPKYSLWFLAPTRMDKKSSELVGTLHFFNPDILRSWRAMQLHHSQYVWYRKLFVIFSQYTYFNQFTPVGETRKSM